MSTYAIWAWGFVCGAIFARYIVAPIERRWRFRKTERMLREFEMRTVGYDINRQAGRPHLWQQPDGGLCDDHYVVEGED